MPGGASSQNLPYPLPSSSLTWSESSWGHHGTPSLLGEQFASETPTHSLLMSRLGVETIAHGQWFKAEVQEASRPGPDCELGELLALFWVPGTQSLSGQDRQQDRKVPSMSCQDGTVFFLSSLFLF